MTRDSTTRRFAKRPWRVVGAAWLTLSALALTAPFPAAADDQTDAPDPGEVEMDVTIPSSGSLTLELAAPSLALGNATYDADLQAWVATAPLPELAVTDSRVIDPGWSLTAAVSPFASQEGRTLDSASVLLRPAIVPATDPDTPQGPEVTLADLVELVSGDDLGSVLASTSAGQGGGRTELGGEVQFEAPAESDPGRYIATLTLTVS